jgi:hypothetical protein
MKARISAPAIVGLITLFILPTLTGAQTILAQRGSEIDGTLTTTLTSKTDHTGDPFSLDATGTWFHKNPLPQGSVIDGHIEDVSPATPTHQATMHIIIDDVRLPDGTVTPLHARVDSIKELEPHKHFLRDTGIVVGSAVVGHILSKKSGKNGGTLAGAATGFALVSTLKSNIVVKKGTLIRLKALDDVARQTT